MGINFFDFYPQAGVILSPVPLPCAAEIFEKLTLTPMAVGTDSA